MRLTRFFFMVAAVGVPSLAASLGGCSASGSSDGTNPTSTTDPNNPNYVGTGASPVPALPPYVPSGTNPGQPAQNPTYAPGDACTRSGAIQLGACGFCGQQKSQCGPDASGKNVWGAWGACEGEVPNGCSPGDSIQEACGFCGTHAKTCSQGCTWNIGACQGQPAGATCAAGTRAFSVGEGCTGAAAGKEHTCAPTCTWDAFSSCEAQPSLTIGAVGTKVSAQFPLVNTTVSSLPTWGTCPLTNLGAPLPLLCVEIKNPNAQSASVDAWESTPETNGAHPTPLDVTMVAYAGSAMPTTDTERKACTGSMSSYCSTAPCEQGQPGLVGSNGVTIPAQGSSVICVQAAYTATTGDFMLNVRTTSLK